MKNQTSRKYLAFLLILSLLCLSMMWIGGTQAQEAPPPMVERYLEPLPLKLSNTHAGPDGNVPHLLAEASSAIADFELGVFQSLQNNNDWNLYTVNSQGGWNQLSSEPSNEIHPRLNRGATKVVFSSDRTGHFDLFVLNLDGSGLAQLTNTGTDNINPAWSPDGNRIAFQSYRDGQAEIYVMDSGGYNVQRLTANPAFDGQPVWSPDGSQIAYTSRTAGYSQIWLMNADGTNARALTSQRGSKPVWSPDGTRIAYAGDENNDEWFELWVVNVDGTNLHRIGIYPPQLIDLIPTSWSPDGRYLAFNRISYIYYEGQWYWEWATLEALDFNTGQAFELPNQRAEWNLDWQTYDTFAPVSTLAALPEISPATFNVSWSGVDAGGAGSILYELQMREGEDGPWVEWQAMTDQAAATFTGVGGRRYSFRVRARDRVYNWEPWPQSAGAVTTVESWPPSSYLERIPAYTRNGSVDLRWSGSDRGNSGIAGYDLQVRQVGDPTWGDFLTRYEWNHFQFGGEVGKSYEFRLRAVDRAGNVEPWPTRSVQTTFYSWRLTSHVVDNAQAPITDANFTSIPTAFETHSEDSGAYTAYIATQTNDQIGIQWQKQGYGFLPLTSFLRSTDAQYTFVLPPADNLLVNSHFEAKTLSDGWQSSGAPLPQLRQDYFHTGQASALLGCPVFSAAVKVAHADGGIIHQFAVDPTGKPHLLWYDQGQSAIYYSRQQTDGSWLAPERVEQEAGYYHAQLQMVVDAGGTVHMVWAWNDTGHIYYKSRSVAGVWSGRQIISTQGQDRYNRSPHIAMDGNGQIHAIWLQQPDSKVVYALRNPAGQWSAPIEISNVVQEAALQPLVVGSDGRVQVIWFERPMPGEGTIASRLIYRQRKSNGDWGAQQVLWEAHRDYYYFSFGTAEVNGRLYVAWQEEIDQRGRVLFLQQDPQGNWGNREEVVPFGYSVASLTATAAGDVVIMLQDGQHLRYAERRQGGWSQPETLSTTLIYDQRPDMVADEIGSIHVVWSESQEPTSTILYRRRTPDGSWLPAQRLAQLAHGIRQAEVLTGSTGRLYIGYAGWQDLYLISRGMSSGGSSVLAQKVTIPAGMNSPVLSFQSWAEGFNSQNQGRFNLEVSDAFSTTTLSTITSSSNGWIHR